MLLNIFVDILLLVDPQDGTMTSPYFSGSTTPTSSNTATDTTGAFSVHVTKANIF